MLTIQHYLMRMAVAALAGLLLWGLSYPLRRRFDRGKRPVRAAREGTLLFLFMFLAGLLFLTLTPPKGWAYHGPFQGTVNLIPLCESIRLFRFYWKNEMWTTILVNFLGNIVMFVPIGFFASLLSDRPRWWKGTLWTFLLSLFIEVSQLFVCRGTDVDNLILNTLGGLLGYGLFLLVRRLDPGFVRRCGKS